MNPKEAMISQFDGINPKPVGEISIYKFCIKVMAGVWARQVREIRNETNKYRRSQLKIGLTAFTMSGTFRGKRNESNLKKHSGFICADIDSKPNPQVTDWIGLRDMLSQIPEVYFAALSASGQGVFLIIPLDYPDRHRDHFKMLSIDIKDKFGLTVDSLPDVSRLRFATNDDARINEQVVPYKRLYVPSVQSKTFQRTHQAGDVFAWAVRMVEKDGIRFADGSKHDYILKLCRFLSLKGVPKFDAEAFIDKNYMPVSEIRSNCLNYPYKNH